MADYFSRSPKFEAPPLSKYDMQFVVRAIENLDEAFRATNTPPKTPKKNLLDHNSLVNLCSSKDEQSIPIEIFLRGF